ncbi:MAG: hypothetical protein ABH846_04490 [Patescibacteria group bacterium]
MREEFPTFEPDYTLEANLNRLPKPYEPVLSVRSLRIALLVGVILVTFCLTSICCTNILNFVIREAPVNLPSTSVLMLRYVVVSTLLLIAPTLLLVLTDVGGRIRYVLEERDHIGRDPRVELFKAFNQIVQLYGDIERHFTCLSWAVKEGLIDCPCPRSDLESFGFYREILLGYQDYLKDTLKDDGWLGELKSDDDSRFAPLIPRLREAQKGLEKWSQHYAQLIADVDDLPDDAPEDCW